jgi:protein gp37
MAETTKIQWTSSTWNPWRGCTKVHAGCDHCYAEAWSHRNPAQLGVWGDEGTRVSGADSMWNAPLRWQRQAEKTGKRHSCFPSLMDPFEDRADLVPLRERMFSVIDKCPLVDFLLLTKRPENVRRMWAYLDGDTTGRIPHWMDERESKDVSTLFRRNVWIGTSVSDQATADKYVPELLKLRNLTPVLFLSAEPLVGPVDLRSINASRDIECNSLSGEYRQFCEGGVDHPGAEQLFDGGPHLDWVIVGGESGPKARPCDVAWVRSIVEQCRAAAVPCFVKQLGAITVDSSMSEPDGTPGIWLGIRDPKGGDPDEWPEDLRVREFPEVERLAR